MSVAGLYPDQVKTLYDTGLSQLDKERKYPLDVLKAIESAGLSAAHANYYDEVAKAKKAQSEEEANERRAFDEYIIDAHARLENAKANGKPIEGILPIGMDEATFRLVSSLSPKTAMAVIKDWTSIEKQNQAPVKNFEQLFINKLIAGEKIPKEYIDAYTQLKKIAQVDPTLKGTMQNEIGKKVAARLMQLTDPLLSKDAKLMQQIQQDLKPDQYGNVNYSAALGRLYTSKDPGAQEAISKLRMIESLYESYASKGISPTQAEPAIDALLRGGQQTPGQTTEPGKLPKTSSNYQTSTYDHLIKKHAAAFSVDPDLMKRVMLAESSGNPEAISSKGALGLMQVLPSTAKSLGYKPEDMKDPDKALEAGAKYLAQLSKIYKGDAIKTVAAYNWGPDRVKQDKPLPALPEETFKYLIKVFGATEQRGNIARLSNGTYIKLRS